MKTKTLLLAALLSVILLSCKKNKDEKKKPDCLITTMSFAGQPDIKLTYDADGRVQTMARDKYVVTFTYSGNTTTATATSDGAFSIKKIITLNSDGLVTNVRMENNSSGTDWNNDAYEYNGTQLARDTRTDSKNITPSVQTVTWTNGNPTSISDDSGTETYSYYPDKLFQQGDYLNVNYLIEFNYQVLRPKNLLKSITAGSNIYNISYSFDGDGKISTVTVTETSGTNTINYQYQCN